MSCDSLTAILDFASPLVDAAQTAIVGWAAYRLAGTSKDVRSISQVTEANFVQLHGRQPANGSAPTAQDPKRS
jgi:predicted RNase H-like nuclease